MSIFIKNTKLNTPSNFGKYFISYIVSYKKIRVDRIHVFYHTRGKFFFLC